MTAILARPCFLTAARVSRRSPSAWQLFPAHQHRLIRSSQSRLAAFPNAPAIRPHIFPTDGVPLLPTDVRFEEERLINYKPENFYPVRLGDIFESKYQVVAKLGFGTASTVWLCRDLQDNSLRTLKVCAVGESNTQEAAVSRYLRSIEIDHPGKAHVRIALDDFDVKGPNGLHQCLVFPALGMTVTHVRDLVEERALDKTLLQRFLFFVVTALDVIHQAGIVHTDLSPNNILVGAGDSVVAEVEQVELSNPSPRKVLADRTIHLSYTVKTTFDPPVITDFGAARIGQPGQKHPGDVMPAPFRAPEVIAGMEWDSQIDIWSVGVMIWNLLEDGNLFKPFRNGHLNDEQHFAQMVSLMGPPPREFLDRSDQCHKYWDSEGNWIAATSIPAQTLESREMRLDGTDRVLLLALLRKILKWLPEERPSAQDLFEDDSIVQFMSEVKPAVS